MKRLYVGNLSEATTANAIRFRFEAFGAVKRVTVVTDREGRSRGFCFVEMTNNSEADKVVLALDGRDFAGRKLRVEVAHPQWNLTAETRVLRYDLSGRGESPSQNGQSGWSRAIFIAQKAACARSKS